MRYSTLKLNTFGKQKELALNTFLLALGVATVFFLPFIIFDKGYFLFYGDFNVQQIPFYQHCHAMVKEGSIGWDFGTDLGVNFIGSYSFYLLGSPFFWFTLLFPNSFVPYLMGPLLILKFAFSAFTAYLFIRRFTRTPQAARLGAMLYAFSGFSVYNIFFNHFHEAIIFFPLLLLSLELLITENRRGFFAGMVAITAITNYFFFFGMVVFTVIYWFVRTFSKCYKITFKGFLVFVFEAVLGLLISAAILLPTAVAVLGNSRISEILVGWNGIMYGKEQIYLNILECFFFPPDLPARPIFFPDADVKWSSLGGWLPLFSMVGVFACLQQKKGHWTRRLLGIMIFMALVPILNSSFYMFNYAYYARWYYMPILIMALVTATATEDNYVSWKSPYKWVSGITLATVLVFGLFPRSVDENGKINQLGLITLDGEGEYTFLLRFIATSLIALVSLAILGLLLKIIRQNRRQFIKYATVMVMIVSIIYSMYFIGTGKTHSYASDVMINDLIEEELDLPGDKTTYRIDVYDGIDNTGMFLDYSCINAFHSIVPSGVTEFWEYVGEERGVAARPTTSSVAARSLLGVKYLLVPKIGEEKDKFLDDSGEPLMSGFELLKEVSGYYVYENKNYIPFGFTYDYYVTETQCDEVDESSRSNLMLKAMVLTDAQAKKYSKYMENLEESDTTVGNFYGGLDSYYFDEFEMEDDAAALNQSAISSFERSANSFKATVTTKKANLLFFSIPYEAGWSATVNGKAVHIEKVNKGFMAVEVPKGASTVTFTYKTPGLELGIMISAGALIILVIYVTVFIIGDKKGKIKVPQYPEGDRMIEAFKRDLKIEKMMEVKEAMEEAEESKDAFSEKLEFYTSGDDKDFSRGFWVNLKSEDLEDDQEGEKEE